MTNPVRQRHFGLDFVRVLAILGVVIIHSTGRFTRSLVPEVKLWADILGYSFQWAVPVFVMISGALLLTPRAATIAPKDFLVRRFSRIGPAMIFWSIFYYLLVRGLAFRKPMSVGDFFQRLVDNGIAVHLYFMWLIGGLCLVAPMLARFLYVGEITAKTKLSFAFGALLWGMLIVQVPIVFGRGYSWEIFSFWVPYVGYFLLGAVLANIRLRPWQMVVVGVVAVVAAGVGIARAHGSLPRIPLLLDVINYLGLTTATCAVVIFLLATQWTKSPGPRWSRVITRLSNDSFGIYLGHMAILLFLPNLLPLARTELAFFPVTVAIAFSVSVLVTEVLKKIPVLERVV